MFIQPQSYTVITPLNTMVDYTKYNYIEIAWKR